MASAQEFEALYEASRDRLAGQLYALTGDQQGAFDLVQEAFIRTWVRWDRIGNYDNPEAFVRRVAFNLAKSQWRRVKRTRLAASPPDAGSVDPDPSSRRDLITALLSLSTREREVIVLHYLAGQTIDEIARDLKIPSGTVKSLLSRGRARLAERLAVRDPEEMTRYG